MSDKPVKSLWHSGAVALGPILCFVKSGPHKSKKNPNNKDYFTLEIDGAERYYNVENDHCSQVLKSLVGRKAMIEFTGRDTDASISICGAGQQQNAPEPEPDEPPDFANQPRRERTPAPKQEPLPAGQQEAENIAKARGYVTQLANLLNLCNDAAVFLAGQFILKHPDAPKPTEVTIAMQADNLSKSAQVCGVHELLPTKLMEKPIKAAGGGK